MKLVVASWLQELVDQPIEISSQVTVFRFPRPALLACRHRNRSGYI